MPDAFISYSRRDKAFVKSLHSSFAALGRDIWVDWEDIPLTGDWRAEIFDGIANSDNFVFVVSPESAVSVECRKEIEAAVANNKRIIPIAIADLKGPAYEALHPSISSHNWIFCREGQEDYDTVFKALVNSMDTDLAHVREHTRLLVRATEWDSKKRNSGYLLAGLEIPEAEKWLATAHGKKPFATDLHAAYIYASRQAALRRQRILMSAALVATVLMAILAILAVFQWFEARRNANVARSRELAANAQAAMTNGRFDLAIALGLRAAGTSDAPLDVTQVLAQAAYEPGTRRVYTGQDAEVIALAVSPDGALAVSSGSNEILYVWDLSTGAIIRPLEGNAGVVSRVVFSADGSQVYSDSADGSILVWDIEGGTIAHQLQADAGEVLALGVGAQDGTVLSGYSDGSVVVWNAADGEETGRFQTRENAGTMVFSADGREVAVVVYDETTRLSVVSVWDIAAGELNTDFEVSGEVSSAVFSTVGRYLLFAMASFAMQTWDVQTGELQTAFEGHEGQIWSMAFSPDSRLIVSASEDSSVREWDAASGQQVRRFLGHTGAVRAVGFVSRTQGILTGSRDQTLRRWDLVNPLQQQSYLGLTQVVDGLAFNSDDSVVIGGSWDGVIRWWDAATGAEQGQFTRHQEAGVIVQEIIYNLATEHILSVGGPTAFWWSLADGAPVYNLVGHPDWIFGSALTPDGTRAVTGDFSGAVLVWDLPVGSGVEDTVEIQPVQTIQLDSFSVSALALSPDGRTVALGSWGGDVLLLDLESETTRALDVGADSGIIYAVDFSPDGRTLLAAGERAIITLVNVESGQLIRSLWGHGNTIVSARFSPDGTRILSSGSADRTVRLWDAQTGQELNRLNLDQDVYQVVFNQATDEVLIGLTNGRVLLWEISTLALDELRTWIDANRFVPTFTCIEQRQYRFEPLDPACETA